MRNPDTNISTHLEWLLSSQKNIPPPKDVMGLISPPESIMNRHLSSVIGSKEARSNLIEIGSEIEDGRSRKSHSDNNNQLESKWNWIFFFFFFYVVLT